MIIKNPGKLHLLKLYLYRVLTRTGPHGKKCLCPKWGWYVGGCTSPNTILVIEHRTHARIGDSSPAEQLHVSDTDNEVDEGNYPHCERAGHPMLTSGKCLCRAYKNIGGGRTEVRDRYGKLIEILVDNNWLHDFRGGGYQPETGLDQENPPQGGSGVPGIQ